MASRSVFSLRTRASTKTMRTLLGFVYINESLYFRGILKDCYFYDTIRYNLVGNSVKSLSLLNSRIQYRTDSSLISQEGFEEGKVSFRSVEVFCSSNELKSLDPSVSLVMKALKEKFSVEADSKNQHTIDEIYSEFSGWYCIQTGFKADRSVASRGNGRVLIM